jgi:hypothetical protein
MRGILPRHPTSASKNPGGTQGEKMNAAFLPERIPIDIRDRT